MLTIYLRLLSSLGPRTQRARTRSLPRADLVVNEPPFPSTLSCYLTPDSGVYHCPTQGHGLSIGYNYPSVSRFLRSPILSAGSRRCKLENMVSLLPALAPAMESSLGTRSNSRIDRGSQIFTAVRSLEFYEFNHLLPIFKFRC